MNRETLAFRAATGVALLHAVDDAFLRFLACWEGGKLAGEPFEYVMAGTPRLIAGRERC